MLSIISCALWPYLCLLQRNVHLHFWPIFFWGGFNIALQELSVCVRDTFSVGISICKNFVHSEGCVFLSLMLCKRFQCLLGPFCLFLFVLILRDASKRTCCILCQSVFCFFSSTVSQYLYFYLDIYLEFTFVYGNREYSNFILIFFAKEPAQCPPQWLLSASSLSNFWSP